MTFEDTVFWFQIHENFKKEIHANLDTTRRLWSLPTPAVSDIVGDIAGMLEDLFTVVCASEGVGVILI